ncbi:MAG: hypothetical protein ACREQY_09100, partial [Candidatus Binatia bacterium]
MKRVLLLLLLLLVAAAGAGRYAFHVLLERPGKPLLEPVRIDVMSGQTFSATVAMLEARQVIPSARALALWARWKGYDRRIQQGAYEFRGRLTPIEALDRMR